MLVASRRRLRAGGHVLSPLLASCSCWAWTLRRLSRVVSRCVAPKGVAARRTPRVLASLRRHCLRVPRRRDPGSIQPTSCCSSRCCEPKPLRWSRANAFVTRSWSYFCFFFSRFRALTAPLLPRGVVPSHVARAEAACGRETCKQPARSPRRKLVLVNARSATKQRLRAGAPGQGRLAS